MKAQSFVSILV